MQIPNEVLAAVTADGAMVYRATGRHTHPLLRHEDSDGVVWLFRTKATPTSAMVGEIVQTPEGAIRVHYWSAADPGNYRTPAELLARRNPPVDPAALDEPTPEWGSEYTHFDPRHLDELMAE